MEYAENNETENMYYAFGKIFQMLTDFEPVIIENAQLNFTNETWDGNTVWGAPLV